ncbi:TIM-barrel domain-containing protein [Homoserinibacter gongjuensis]|uniref:Glycosyl hydrolase family 31 C-terminal domain-containing protein n=1 Tax=Homoserinibacter gongjuensis TaxID=1162968 RepID=A0ABQ6JUE0_9MICO|nr:TIM-barrel domain-containing protein [Homoserinibacter gongjuensis]GMA91905.1 hypothetical protein GCM10025869_24340 [Homoserinibacter gongjuensis]
MLVDQTRNGGAWNVLGNLDLDEGEVVTLTVTASPGDAVTKPDQKAITRADAVRIAPLGAACETVTTAPSVVDAAPADHGAYTLTQSGTSVRIEADAWAMTIDRAGFRYGFERDGASIAPAHGTTGLLLGADTTELCAAVSAELVSADADGVEFAVLFSNGRTATVEVGVSEASADIDVAPDGAATSVIRAQLAGGMNPAYGLGDLGGWRSSLNAYGVKNLDYYAQTSGGTTEQRFVSNFAVFPDRGFAEVAFDRGHLAVQIDGQATLLGVTGERMDGLHYFFGDLPTIYGAYKHARNAAGYFDARPDYTFFGVGYESYGALGYNTNQATITQSVTDYLAKGFPISWAVTGSGFWPYVGGAQGTTSSFGMWGEKYPDPDAYKSFFADNDIALILGLRQSFPALPEDGGTYDPEKDGPFVQEALDAGYFISDEDGDPLTFSTISFPSGRVYLIDPDNADAVAWFVEHERLWEADGFKEDHMFNATANNAFAMNDLVNNIDAALADDGALMMVRNSAYSVPGSILRINDTDYNQGTGDRDRTVINSLAYAASGQANYYPDIVGGRIMADLSTNADKQKYLARNAMYAAMSPSMSFGNEPWVMSDTSLVDATIAAAQWHAEYQPYIYAAAIASYETGYPYTATPLPIAYPHDAATYELVSKTAKQYEWMLGTSLLVAPLYGADATTATARDIYLPAGSGWTSRRGDLHRSHDARGLPAALRQDPGLRGRRRRARARGRRRARGAGLPDGGGRHRLHDRGRGRHHDGQHPDRHGGARRRRRARSGRARRLRRRGGEHGRRGDGRSRIPDRVRRELRRRRCRRPGHRSRGGGARHRDRPARPERARPGTRPRHAAARRRQARRRARRGCGERVVLRCRPLRPGEPGLVPGGCCGHGADPGPVEPARRCAHALAVRGRRHARGVGFLHAGGGIRSRPRFDGGQGCVPDGCDRRARSRARLREPRAQQAPSRAPAARVETRTPVRYRCAGGPRGLCAGSPAVRRVLPPRVLDSRGLQPRGLTAGTAPPGPAPSPASALQPPPPMSKMQENPGVSGARVPRVCRRLLSTPAFSTFGRADVDGRM